MTHDPETAERLANEQADAYFVGMHDDVVHDWAQEAADLFRNLAALIRAQAAEIARLTALDTPAPQPDADEREALVRVVEATGPIYSTVDAETIADALLAAGWTRKREEG